MKISTELLLEILEILSKEGIDTDDLHPSHPLRVKYKLKDRLKKEMCEND